ncbi:MAG: S4 domain-containing protein [Candidatus Pacearchaeota archaeon]
MHRKRQSMPKTWPLPRKGTKYISSSGNFLSIPVYVIIRDIIRIVNNRKDVKKIIKEGRIFVNNKKIKDEKFPVQLKDIIEIDKKIYTLDLNENKKLTIKEILNEKKEIIAKILNKKKIDKNKIQINCTNGRNYLIDYKENKNIKIGDSVLFDLNNKKIIEILPLKEGSKVLVINGKHIGKRGIIEKIDKEKNIATIKISQEKINALLDYIMVEK